MEVSTGTHKSLDVRDSYKQIFEGVSRSSRPVVRLRPISPKSLSPQAHQITRVVSPLINDYANAGRELGNSIAQTPLSSAASKHTNIGGLELQKKLLETVENEGRKSEIEQKTITLCDQKFNIRAVRTPKKEEGANRIQKIMQVKKNSKRGSNCSLMSDLISSNQVDELSEKTGEIKGKVGIFETEALSDKKKSFQRNMIATRSEDQQIEDANLDTDLAFRKISSLNSGSSIPNFERINSLNVQSNTNSQNDAHSCPPKAQKDLSIKKFYQTASSFLPSLNDGSNKLTERQQQSRGSAAMVSRQGSRDVIIRSSKVPTGYLSLSRQGSRQAQSRGQQPQQPQQIKKPQVAPEERKQQEFVDNNSRAKMHGGTPFNKIDVTPLRLNHFVERMKEGGESIHYEINRKNEGVNATKHLETDMKANLNLLYYNFNNKDAGEDDKRPQSRHLDSKRSHRGENLNNFENDRDADEGPRRHSLNQGPLFQIQRENSLNQRLTLKKKEQQLQTINEYEKAGDEEEESMDSTDERKCDKKKELFNWEKNRSKFIVPEPMSRGSFQSRGGRRVVVVQNQNPEERPDSRSMMRYPMQSREERRKEGSTMSNLSKNVQMRNTNVAIVKPKESMMPNIHSELRGSVRLSKIERKECAEDGDFDISD